MGADTEIAWTDDTFNPWWGCVRVSPGCEHCYAETFAKRVGHSTTGTKLPIWGVDASRRAMSDKHWGLPFRWNREAIAAGKRRRVFCASMADVFEVLPDRNVEGRRVQDDARKRLWFVIETTPALDWLLLTKRPENVARLAPWSAERNDWPANVWLGTTAEDQAHYDRRWPFVAKSGARTTFISHEPALGPLVLRCHGCGGTVGDHLAPDQGGCSGWFPDWVITGGESGGGARPYDLAWTFDLVEQCKRARIACFVKQIGAEPRSHGAELIDSVKDRKGGNPLEWPEGIRVREWPRAGLIAG